MSFTEQFIRKPIMTTLLMVMVLSFGLAAYFKLPVSDLPVVDSPVITVSVSYPGASPQTMASAVASPLENEFTQIPGLKSMISDNTEGASQIILTFELNRSVDLAAPDVQAAIQRAMSNLPTDLPEPPTYEKTNPSDMPIMYLIVTSDTLTAGQLYDYANKRIAQRLSMIEGVSQVLVWGAKTAVRIQADPDKLASYKLDVNEVAAAVAAGTVTIPGGSLNGPKRAFSIEPQGQLFKADEYKGLIVAYRDNAPVRLGEIATCVDSTDNDVVSVMFGHAGEEMQTGSCVIPISRAAGANTVALAAKIKNTVEELKTEIPGSVKLDIFYDKSESIVESINDVKTTILIAIGLVILVIFVFLGRLTDTVIPAITLPLTIVATFLVMSALNYTLDNLSLMGIILAVGFVVDDSIVVLENTVRLIEQGKKPLQAAIQSASEITFTILSMTLSLAVIFIPLVFMGGVIGRTFREFAVTVVATILCSGVISIILSPMMCARMLKEKSLEQTKLEKFTGDFSNAMIRKYGVLLKWCMDRKFLMMVAWVVCVAGSVALFAVMPKTFLPEGDSGAIQGGFIVPLGTSTAQMQRYQDRINKVLLSDPNVEKAITVTGLAPGADQSKGVCVAVLKPKNKRLKMEKVVPELRKKLYFIPDGFVFLEAIPTLKVGTGGEATATGSKYSYTMTGPDQDELYDGALKLEQKLRTTDGFVDIQNSIKLDLPQVEIEILRDRASTLGITAQEIESALARSFAQGKTTTFKTDIDQYDVIVELEKKYQSWPDDLSRIYLHSKTTDGFVPLSSITRQTLTVGPQDVPHYNQLPSATLSFNLAPGMPLGTATTAIAASAKELLPPGTTGQLQGEAQEFESSIASLGILLIIAIFIKYIILGILYESYTHPMTIITTLPVATFGGLLTLFFLKPELSLYAYVGIFMLLGIVAKNGIMMVDFANVNMEEGKNAYDAIHDACLVRFRPILMTGLAAIMGAVPLALGYGADGESRMPLGLIVVGGLIFSQIITLFVTPAIFLYMQKFQEKFLDRFELTRSMAARKHE